MLTTPARSLKTPDSAPSVIGTAFVSEVFSNPAKFSDLPAAAHVRKLKMKNSATTPSIRFVRLPNPSCELPRADKCAGKRRRIQRCQRPEFPRLHVRLHATRHKAERCQQIAVRPPCK